MLIWTTSGPRRATKPASNEPSDEAFAESSKTATPSAEHGGETAATPSADVFLDPAAHAPGSAAADDDDWSSAETPRPKAPETAE